MVFKSAASCFVSFLSFSVKWWTLQSFSTWAEPIAPYYTTLRRVATLNVTSPLEWQSFAYFLTSTYFFSNIRKLHDYFESDRTLWTVRCKCILRIFFSFSLPSVQAHSLFFASFLFGRNIMGRMHQLDGKRHQQQQQLHKTVRTNEWTNKI